MDNEEKKTLLLNAFREGESEMVMLGDPKLRYEYTRPDGTKGTFGSCRKIFRVINKDLTGSEKFVVGIAIFAPGEGGPVHVHDDAEEFSYIISGGGVQLDKDYHVVGEYKKGDFKFVPAGAYHGGFCTSDEPMVQLFAYSSGGELPTK